jgi:phosphoglycolate phosphatase-like HAD superfamily hydrolase
VHELLTFLLRFPNVIKTIATGNFEGIARKKLELAGIAHFFVWEVASFGNVADRADIVRASLAKCVSRGDEIARAAHVGDTPQDAMAAQAAGFSAVVVTTGRRTSGFPAFASVFPEFTVDTEFIEALGVFE